MKYVIRVRPVNKRKDMWQGTLMAFDYILHPTILTRARWKVDRRGGKARSAWATTRRRNSKYIQDERRSERSGWEYQ